MILDVSYSFTTADTTPPQIAEALAIDLKRVRVTFTEAVNVVAIDTPSSALDPADWALARLGDYLRPLVSASVVGVERVSPRTVDLLTDIALTPGGTYRVSATALEDLAGNPCASEYDFLGWTPPVPEGRSIDLYRKVPEINRREDDTRDLERFVGCLQEVLTLLLYDIDRFTDIIDPDLAPEAFVDAMLADLGNPFAFDLTLTDKRRLAQVLVAMYRLKGTKIGIEAVVRFFLGLEVSVDPYNGTMGTWTLGDGELGLTSTLGTTDPALLYAFEVVIGVAVTAAQRAQLGSIVEYMKPAHTHYKRLVVPVIPVVLDPWELGLSALGEDTFLH